MKQVEDDLVRLSLGLVQKVLYSCTLLVSDAGWFALQVVLDKCFDILQKKVLKLKEEKKCKRIQITKKKIKHIGLGQTPTLSEQKLIWLKVVINQPKMTISDIGNMLMISPIYWGVIIADDSVLQCWHKPARSDSVIKRWFQNTSGQAPFPMKDSIFENHCWILSVKQWN